MTASDSTLSVIIPAWCEVQRIRHAVGRAREIGDEVIVADAGSPDGTAEEARAAGARVVSASKGRGKQLDAGARVATGDVLLFLHADAEIHSNARAAVFGALQSPHVLGGNFRICFEPPSLATRVFNVIYHLGRTRLAVYYGDSGLFLRRETYATLGGFRPMPLFEDYDLVRKLEGAGKTAYLRDIPIRVSSRRFERAPVSTFLLGAVLQMFFWGGVPPDRLVRVYRDFR